MQQRESPWREPKDSPSIRSGRCNSACSYAQHPTRPPRFSSFLISVRHNREAEVLLQLRDPKSCTQVSLPAIAHRTSAESAMSRPDRDDDRKATGTPVARNRATPTSPSTSPSFFRQKIEKAEAIKELRDKAMRIISSSAYQEAMEENARVTGKRAAARIAASSPIRASARLTTGTTSWQGWSGPRLHPRDRQALTGSRSGGKRMVRAAVCGAASRAERSRAVYACMWHE